MFDKLSMRCAWSSFRVLPLFGVIYYINLVFDLLHYRSMNNEDDVASVLLRMVAASSVERINR